MPGNINKSDVGEYMALFPELILDLLESAPWKDAPGETKQWLATLLYKCVPNEELLHGLATAVALKHLVPNPKPEQVKEAHVMGWCLQMFASCYFILDDLLDNASTRHYQPCWHLVNNRGMKVMNDAVLIENAMYFLLRKHFGARSFYPDLLHILHDLSFKMALSQSLENQLRRQRTETGTLDHFSMETYTTLVHYKMSYFPTYIHVLMATKLAGMREIPQEATAVLHKIDFHFQLRDDFCEMWGADGNGVETDKEEDLFEEHENESSNDIDEGRITWNICKALSLASDQQRQVLLEKYGKGKEEGAEDAIRQVFESLHIPVHFRDYEDQEYQHILRMIHSLNLNQESDFPSDLLVDMLWASFPSKLREEELSGRFSPPQASQVSQEEVSMRSMKSLSRDITRFLGVFPDVISDILNHPAIHDNAGNLISWITRVLHCNVSTGKKARGLTTAIAYKMLSSPPPSREHMTKAYILGWCVEMLQGAALIADDIMDESVKRRGRDCWYKVEDMGHAAFNDATFLESAVYRVLRTRFGHEPYYTHLLHLFQDTTFKTGLGQGLDVLTSRHMDLSLYTMERYESIVKYKTSYYTFYLPVFLAMAILRFQDHGSDLQQQAKTFLLNLGTFFQAQDDYLDCFGSVDRIGKIGTDIADGKCSWLVVTALEMATTHQYHLIQDNYGKGLDDKVGMERIRELYVLLSLPQKFHDYEATTFGMLEGVLDAMPIASHHQKSFFTTILQSTYKRKA